MTTCQLIYSADRYTGENKGIRTTYNISKPEILDFADDAGAPAGFKNVDDNRRGAERA